MYALLYVRLVICPSCYMSVFYMSALLNVRLVICTPCCMSALLCPSCYMSVFYISGFWTVSPWTVASHYANWATGLPETQHNQINVTATWWPTPQPHNAQHITNSTVHCRVPIVSAPCPIRQAAWPTTSCVLLKKSSVIWGAGKFSPVFVPHLPSSSSVSVPNLSTFLLSPDLLLQKCELTYIPVGGTLANAVLPSVWISANYAPDCSWDSRLRHYQLTAADRTVSGTCSAVWLGVKIFKLCCFS